MSERMDINGHDWRDNVATLVKANSSESAMVIMSPIKMGKGQQSILAAEVKKLQIQSLITNKLGEE